MYGCLIFSHALLFLKFYDLFLWMGKVADWCWLGLGREICIKKSSMNMDTDTYCAKYV